MDSLKKAIDLLCEAPGSDEITQVVETLIDVQKNYISLLDRLALVTKERNELRKENERLREEVLNLESVAMSSIEYVAYANYNEREIEAKCKVRQAAKQALERGEKLDKRGGEK